MQSLTGGRSPTVGDGTGLLWTLVPGDPERIRAIAERFRAAL